MWSWRASPSSVVLCANEPLAAMSSYRVESLLRRNQKYCNNTWLGIDKSRPKLDRVENLSQATPIVSLTCCWKLSISCRRAAIRDIGNNARQNLFLSSSQSPFTFPTLWAYHCFALSFNEKGNKFHRSISYDMPAMVRQA